MRLVRPMLLAMTALMPLPLAAQTTGSSDDPDKSRIVVTGKRDANGKPVEMSDWRVAETAHVIVYSKGDEQRLAAIAHNLEKLHFLLSVLLNRVDAPDEALKLNVTLIGDYADFNHLDLNNIRWQQGPYPKAFPSEIYYDPREDGAVLATTNIDQSVVLQQGRSLASISNLEPTTTGGTQNSLGGPSGGVAEVSVNGSSVPLSAAGRLYRGFAQHYLLTYFPAAYPRWYLDGFGEMFATLTSSQDGAIEYGRAPEGFREVMETYGRYPLKNVLSGQYLKEKESRTSWNPFRAWALVHLLFFSEEWRAPLNRYLSAVARGTPPEEAAKALGDVEKLQSELAVYSGRKVPFERMTFPAERAPTPNVRRLTRSEAFVRDRLELGARVEIPPAPPAGADPETADRMNKARQKAIAARDSWLQRLRQSAARYAAEPQAQILLAEAECRSGNADGCLAAAERALALAPESPPAMAWKGVALTQQAIAAPASARKNKLRVARAAIARANRADTEAVLPLLAYYRSFADAGETAPDVAVDGLAKAVALVPSAPTTRLLLGSELARRGEADAARKTLRPVADGPYDSPERAKARAVLESLAKK